MKRVEALKSWYWGIISVISLSYLTSVFYKNPFFWWSLRITTLKNKILSMPHMWVTGYVMVHKQLTDPRTNVQNFVSHPTHIICICYFVNFRHNRNAVILSKYCPFAFSSCNNLGVCRSGCTTFLIFHICDHPNILSVHDYPVVALESQKTEINLPIPQLCWSSCCVSLSHLLSGDLSVFDQFLPQFWLLCKPRAVVASTFSFRKFSYFRFFPSNFSLTGCQ